MAEKLATRFGNLVWFDDSTGTTWDDYMWIRVNLSINNPLKKKLKLNIGGELVEYMVKYEKLPLFYHSCGRIGHPKLRCPRPSNLQVDPFGLEMRKRAPGPRNWLSHTAKKEDAEIWAILKKKFEMECTGSNFENGTPLAREEVARTSKEEAMGGERNEREMEQPAATSMKDNSGNKPQKPLEANVPPTKGQGKELNQEKEAPVVGALQKFKMGNGVGLITRRHTGNVWRRQEQKKERYQQGTQLTPQKRNVDTQGGDMDIDLEVPKHPKKAKVLDFHVGQDKDQQGRLNNLDGDLADSVVEQSRPAQ
ncbi:unnamed protein product [Linum trigynum]|uniref:Zinc knuckle CX2CX4HX4C domain-containing protein n=1 Tax=Linum trigynum TaxID=586398 RepID=A0AAV2FVP9_9ROSI